MSKNPKSNNNLKVFSVWVAIILSISLGIIITIGGCLWAISRITQIFKISYSGYAMVILCLLILSELWAIFILIPSIRGYQEMISETIDYGFKVAGIILIAVLFIIIMLYNSGDGGRWFQIKLAEGIYGLSRMVDTKDYEQRLGILNELIMKEGTDSGKFAERGKLYFDIGCIKKNKDEGYDTLLIDYSVDSCFSNAIQDYSDAITGFENEPEGENDEGKSRTSDMLSECYYQRGKAYFESVPAEEYSNAKNDFEKAIEINGENEAYYYMCARAWYSIGDYEGNNAYDKALTNIETAIDKHLDAPKYKEQFGILIPNQQQIEENESLDKVLAEYYYYEGMINKEMDKPDSMNNQVACFEKAVQYDMTNEKYCSLLGEAYYKLKDGDSLEAAEKEFDHAIELNKKASDYDNEAINVAWKAFVIEAQNNNRTEEVLNLYGQAISMRRDYPFAYRRMAEIYSDQGKKDKQGKILNKAINNCQDNAEFYYECGALHYKLLQDYSHTIDDMNHAIQGRFSVPENCYWYIASSYYCQKDYKKALENYELALQNGYNAELVREYMDYCQYMLDEESE